MKIAILGGGITGLTAAYDLSKKDHTIVLFEKSKTLGGLAVGFKEKGWEWPLEYAYHHLFSNDHDILDFAKETGFDDIFFKKPHTDSLYEEGIFPLDSPVSLLRFPLLSVIEKIRTSVILAYLKLSPFLPIYESMTTQDFLTKTMGKHAQNVLFGELLRKKYGKYAGNILATWIWTRVKKRTPKLGYISGGFQTFTEHVERMIVKQGVVVKKGEGVGPIIKKGKKFLVNGQLFDVVISTLPTPALGFIAKKVFPQNYLNKFSKLNYLWAQTLIVQTEKPVLKKSYWLNVCIPTIPFLVLVQHTNFVSKKRYGDKHLLYVGNYLDETSPLLKMTDKALFKHFKPYIEALSSKSTLKDVKTFRFQAPYAQPIFDKNFIKNKPDFITPVPNFYIANLDMTYPNDRGTNYAVKLGREVAELVLKRVL
ncbi:MAG: FAD-dependent oxidoreductase [Microgenomates group bacterium]